MTTLHRTAPGVRLHTRWEPLRLISPLDCRDAIASDASLLPVLARRWMGSRRSSGTCQSRTPCRQACGERVSHLCAERRRGLQSVFTA